MSEDRIVEEKIGEQNFRVLSEMRILAKIKVVILDLVGYVYFPKSATTNLVSPC